VWNEHVTFQLYGRKKTDKISIYFINCIALKTWPFAMNSFYERSVCVLPCADTRILILCICLHSSIWNSHSLSNDSRVITGLYFFIIYCVRCQNAVGFDLDDLENVVQVSANYKRGFFSYIWLDLSETHPSWSVMGTGLFPKGKVAAACS
jgi:hypothetical protein